MTMNDGKNTMDDGKSMGNGVDEMNNDGVFNGDDDNKAKDDGNHDVKVAMTEPSEADWGPDPTPDSLLTPEQLELIGKFELPMPSVLLEQNAAVAIDNSVLSDDECKMLVGIYGDMVSFCEPDDPVLSSTPVESPMERAMREVFVEVDMQPGDATFGGITKRSLDDVPDFEKQALMSLNRSFNLPRKPRNIIVTGLGGSGKTWLINAWAMNQESLPRRKSRPLKVYWFDSDRISELVIEMRSKEASGGESADEFINRMVDVFRNRVEIDVADGLHPVVVLTDPMFVAGLSSLIEHASFVVECPSRQLDSTVQSIGDRAKNFDVLDLGSFAPTWKQFVDLATRINDSELVDNEHDDGLVGPMVPVMLRAFFKYGTEEHIVPRTGDTVSMPIGDVISALEQAHAKLIESPIEGEVTATKIRAFGKRFAVEPSSLGIDMDVSSDDDDLGMFDDIEPDSAQVSKGPKVKPSAYSDVSTLADRLKKHIVNQDDAIEQVVDAIKIDAAGLRNQTRPVGVFMFAGPSGVGKTELAKRLAMELYRKPRKFVRIDMGEFGEKYMVSKLFGSSRGYKDSDMGGVLTNAVIEDPQSIILLDEAEKAHPLVWDSMLQVFDNGKATDGLGNVADFRKSIIIMTSNLGNDEALRPKSGFLNSDADADEKERRHFTEKAINKYFKVEFINRLDSIIMFNRLRREDLERITRMQFDELNGNLRNSHHGLSLNVNLDKHMVDWILDKANPDRFGARELQRTIRRLITLPMADWVLSNSIGRKTGRNILNVSYDAKNQQASFDLTKDR